MSISNNPYAAFLFNMVGGFAAILCFAIGILLVLSIGISHWSRSRNEDREFFISLHAPRFLVTSGVLGAISMSVSLFIEREVVSDIRVIQVALSKVLPDQPADPLPIFGLEMGDMVTLGICVAAIVAGMLLIRKSGGLYKLTHGLRAPKISLLGIGFLAGWLAFGHFVHYPEMLTQIHSNANERMRDLYVSRIPGGQDEMIAKAQAVLAAEPDDMTITQGLRRAYWVGLMRELQVQLQTGEPKS